MGKIKITGRIELDEAELSEEFVCSPGPGGQNVNKVASAVRLRFDMRGSSAIPEDAKLRFYALFPAQVSQDGVVLISASRFRDQPRNRADARERLVEMLRTASLRPVKRRPTKPSRASKKRRLDEKRAHGENKKLRGSSHDD
ncbi:MAG: hypothetical protein A2X49_06715 [Lentisphaerae bacterium GWF2_52_8]|nr:MAG: hypothetical protein A2X49_06715 [Lentisphaerae bacterium GWF2_52_8]